MAENTNGSNKKTFTLGEIVSMPKSHVKKEFIINVKALEHELIEYQVCANDACVKTKLRCDENNNYTCSLCNQNINISYCKIKEINRS